MGAAAFIMAEFLGVPYIKIATTAIVPALVYYFAVGTMVHLEALKNNLVGLPRHLLPNIRAILNGLVNYKPFQINNISTHLRVQIILHLTKFSD